MVIQRVTGCSTAHMQRAAASRDLLQGLNGFVDVFHEDTPLHKLSCEDIALYQAVLVADCSEVFPFPGVLLSAHNVAFSTDRGSRPRNYL